MSNACLPDYTPPAPLPEYSFDPLSGEQRLEHTPRPGSRPTPTGVFIRKAKKVTVVLQDQEDDARIPSFGRHAVVSGSLCLEQPEVVSEVIVKLEGRMDLTISEGGSKSHSLVNDSFTLWRSSTCQDSCPSTIPFSIIIPSSYEDGDRSRPLPPSYDVAFPGVPGLFAKVVYNLVIILRKARHPKLSFLTKKQIITIRLNYYPRTRPHRPNLENPSLFSSLKIAPEEWQQASAKMKTRPQATIKSIDCHLMVPAAQIFAVSDTIPFHVQLTGPISSLRAFLPHPVPETVPSSPASSFSSPSFSLPPPIPPPKRGRTRTLVPPKPTIRVFLLRQIAVEVRAQKAWRNCTLGEGKLWPLPPRATSTDCLISADEDAHLDWEGEVRCREDIIVGGFNAGKVTVKDFIVLALTPPDPHTSPLLELQHAHPIRLVTDPWLDTTGPEHDAH
ncbi:hypothetical protein HGRIS_005803 [Hohenbuehelia grisea]|uniref:Arrestin-like N-terminal domain-containing protein n=1 Tax=Hohenbuehelia grisea TaxID=104357 RepID=A0ABR3K078_9AGAR